MQSLTHIIKDKESIIDNREVKKLNKSIIDRTTTDLRVKLKDNTLSEGFVVKILRSLSEYQINSLSDYAVRKGSNPGRAFVGVCEKVMREQSR